MSLSRNHKQLEVAGGQHVKVGSHSDEAAGRVQVPGCGNGLGPDTPPGVKFSEEREGYNSGAEFQVEEPMG